MLEKTFFNREEFELLTARNGLAALRLIRESHPDLVFMDLYMPEMNGDECSLMMKRDVKCHDIPIVMVTQGGREEDLARCRRAGCDDIVLKPINRHDFLSVARKFLQLQERATQRFKARVPVNFWAAENAHSIGYSADISSGGLFLETAIPLSVDTRLNVEFKLPVTDSIIRCVARVAWNNPLEQRKKPQLPAGVGVQFTDIAMADMDAIRDFVRGESLEPSW